MRDDCRTIVDELLRFALCERRNLYVETLLWEEQFTDCFTLVMKHGAFLFASD